VKISPMVFLSL